MDRGGRMAQANHARSCYIIRSHVYFPFVLSHTTFSKNIPMLRVNFVLFLFLKKQSFRNSKVSGTKEWIQSS